MARAWPGEAAHWCCCFGWWWTNRKTQKKATLADTRIADQKDLKEVVAVHTKSHKADNRGECSVYIMALCCARAWKKGICPKNGVLCDQLFRCRCHAAFVAVAVVEVCWGALCCTKPSHHPKSTNVRLKGVRSSAGKVLGQTMLFCCGDNHSLTEASSFCVVVKKHHTPPIQNL